MTEDEKNIERYTTAMHGVQTGVKFEMQHETREGPTSPKHLRVGINSAMVNDEAVANLLIDKGIFTRSEYLKYLADAAEAELARYEARAPEGVKFR